MLIYWNAFPQFNNRERHFRHISGFNRFQRFDDEADINFVKTYLTGIKQQVEENIFNYDVDFKIADFTRIYVNEFRFSNVMVIEVEDNENYVEKLTKMYLKFDFKKNKRLSQAEEKKYIKKYFRHLMPLSQYQLFPVYFRKMSSLIILLEMWPLRFFLSKKNPLPSLFPLPRYGPTMQKK